ncbi:MAG: hypothetical protein FD139_2304 [Methylocystaceae bacterium]|jgi:hypothetical protein|nr:MAG: hypothetical protein FD148_226 [Methylocystaceae bacterium]KAF0213511.1 MAG: hypothetical protein FD172_423 [Methylocystaceae bacterium]TXT44366.1 MAG: hypothetical protein FD139_2304 [Methylocystaceae bacterium]
MMRAAVIKPTKPADSISEAGDPLILSLLSKSWGFRLAVAGSLIIALWTMILWAVSLP